jgi:hypothetical protein
MNLKRYYNAIENRANKYISSRKGFKSSRKIIVIESDDWGSIRMPSKVVYNSLLKAGIPVDNSVYDKYDSLASKEDMSLLFELLSKFKDKNNNSAIITANTLVANPDFKKIKESDFQEYFYELLPETLRKNTDNNIELWYDGIRNKVFYPQFHGREHLNVHRWLKYLRCGLKELLLAFQHETFSIGIIRNYPLFVAELDTDEEDDYSRHLSILNDGYYIFNNIFKYKAKSFIAPNYIWNDKHEKMLSDLGINYIQGSLIQLAPSNNKKYKKYYHYTGQNSKLNQTYLVRNCIFEPSSNPNKDWVDSCLREINIAYNYRKPAIICSHRVNFIGAIDNKNRDKNLKLIQELLKKIITKWPDVEFITSEQLGDLILQSS